MTVEVYFTPFELAPDIPAGKSAAVIDILRASTVTAVALQNGAEAIYPAGSLEHAEELAERHTDERPLLCGERDGKIIPGYDLGNSPLEYTADKINGRTLIHCSTNGTVAMAATADAAHRFMVGLVNTRATVEEIAKVGLDVVIICGGKDGTFALEDGFAAGRLIKLLAEYFPAVNYGNDHAGTVEYIYEKNEDDALALIRDCSHGRYLTELGFGDDLPVCAAIDTVPIVARMDGECLRQPKPAPA